jgi:hypothetical protein
VFCLKEFTTLNGTSCSVFLLRGEIQVGIISLIVGWWVTHIFLREIDEGRRTKYCYRTFSDAIIYFAQVEGVYKVYTISFIEASTSS